MPEERTTNKATLVDVMYKYTCIDCDKSFEMASNLRPISCPWCAKVFIEIDMTIREGDVT